MSDFCTYPFLTPDMSTHKRHGESRRSATQFLYVKEVTLPQGSQPSLRRTRAEDYDDRYPNPHLQTSTPPRPSYVTKPQAGTSLVPQKHSTSQSTRQNSKPRRHGYAPTAQPPRGDSAWREQDHCHRSKHALSFEREHKSRPQRSNRHPSTQGDSHRSRQDNQALPGTSCLTDFEDHEDMISGPDGFGSVTAKAPSALRFAYVKRPKAPFSQGAATPEEPETEEEVPLLPPRPHPAHGRSDQRLAPEDYIQHGTAQPQLSLVDAHSYIRDLFQVSPGFDNSLRSALIRQHDFQRCPKSDFSSILNCGNSRNHGKHKFSMLADIPSVEGTICWVGNCIEFLEKQHISRPRHLTVLPRALCVESLRELYPILSEPPTESWDRPDKIREICCHMDDDDLKSACLMEFMIESYGVSQLCLHLLHEENVELVRKVLKARDSWSSFSLANILAAVTIDVYHCLCKPNSRKYHNDAIVLAIQLLELILPIRHAYTDIFKAVGCHLQRAEFYVFFALFNKLFEKIRFSTERYYDYFPWDDFFSAGFIGHLREENEYKSRIFGMITGFLIQRTGYQTLLSDAFGTMNSASWNEQGQYLLGVQDVDDFVSLEVDRQRSDKYEHGSKEWRLHSHTNSGTEKQISDEHGKLRSQTSSEVGKHSLDEHGRKEWSQKKWMKKLSAAAWRTQNRLNTR